MSLPPGQYPTTPVDEWRDVDLAKFRGEIIPRDRPAVLRGLVKDWPAVAAGRASPRGLCDYIARFDLGRPVSTAVGPPEIGGRLHYRDDLSGFNFERVNEPFRASLARILASLDEPHPPAVYAGAVPNAECFPGFDAENPMPLLGSDVVSRIWASTATTAPTHFDMSDNIACVAAGRRRFTFFPMDQLANLYVGPLEFTPAGQPTSLVKLGQADFDRFPRFRQALEAGQTTELEAGDAVFIPNLWWHNVEALEPFNILVNYWWYDAARGEAPPFAALFLSLLALGQLPANRREPWRKIFEHYVFKADGDPAAHIPPERRGLLGALTPQVTGPLRQWLTKALQRP